MTISELRVQVIKDLGLTTWYGAPKDYVDLENADQQKVTDAMARYIVDHPTEFPGDSVGIARARVASPVFGQGLADTSAGAAVGEFFSEAGNQLASINEAVNPFSESNRGKILWVAVAGAAVYFLAPVIIKAFVGEKGGLKMPELPVVSK